MTSHSVDDGISTRVDVPHPKRDTKYGYDEQYGCERSHCKRDMEILAILVRQV